MKIYSLFFLLSLLLGFFTTSNVISLTTARSIGLKNLFSTTALTNSWSAIDSYHLVTTVRLPCIHISIITDLRLKVSHEADLVIFVPLWDRKIIPSSQAGTATILPALLENWSPLQLVGCIIFTLLHSSKTFCFQMNYKGILKLPQKSYTNKDC